MCVAVLCDWVLCKNVTYFITFLFVLNPFDIIVGGESEDDDNDDDDDNNASNLSSQRKSESRTCSSKDIFDIDANRSGTRSGAKHLFNELAMATVEVVKQYTASAKSTVHDQANQAVCSRKKKFLVLEQNKATGRYQKLRCVTEDSQNYELVNAVANDGKAVQFTDSQQLY